MDQMFTMREMQIVLWLGIAIVMALMMVLILAGFWIIRERQQNESLFEDCRRLARELVNAKEESNRHLVGALRRYRKDHNEDTGE